MKAITQTRWTHKTHSTIERSYGLKSLPYDDNQLLHASFTYLSGPKIYYHRRGQYGGKNYSQKEHSWKNASRPERSTY